MECGFFSLFTLTSLLIFGTAIFILITSVRRFSKSAFGNPDITKVIEQESLDENTPKSLSGMDYIYGPQILEDFPDFNLPLVRTKVRDELREMLKGKENLSIHNVVITNYDRTSVEKTIYFQAALQYREGGRLRQKRYNLHYAFLLATHEGNVIAANCPNCGGAVRSTTQKVCEYCDSRLVNVLSNSWGFTDIYES